ncbi:O-antigen ligase family protein [Termitidicoccus mucosus]|uniref:O-antigen ligase-related domain-containing protein n=1 Tax=Termitidicoccus mucosus TaxID=1184151 RepID=A0A178IFD6_9BACT|nr:hypothetical protein AW736_20170 [Opitutaceae bacterium TSB47]
MTQRTYPQNDHIPPSERQVIILAAVTVTGTAWVFGGRVDWAPPIFLSLSAMTAALSLISSLRERRRLEARVWLPVIVFTLLIGCSLANPSLIPVDRGFGGWIESKNWIPWLPATIDRISTLSAVMPWMSALLLGAALKQVSPGRQAIILLWKILLASGVMLTLAGYYFHFTNPGKIMGIAQAPSGFHFASFIYRNHWSAYTVLLVTLALGFTFGGVQRWIEGNGRLDRALPGAVLALIIAASVPLPGSRSGMVLMALLAVSGSAYFAWRICRFRPAPAQRRERNLALSALLLMGLGMCVAAGIGASSFATAKARTAEQWKRYQEGEHLDLRWPLIKDTFRMARARPVYGWGLGTFGQVIPTYQGDYLRNEKNEITTRIFHAHCDWLELWAEVGLVGGLVLIIPPACLLWRGLRHGHSRVRWILAGCILIGCYAWVEFPFHNPAVLLLWTTLVVTASQFARPDKEREGTSMTRLR